jgi:hypothetical protein
LIRVDSNTFTWMGNPTGANTPNANQVAFEYTSTKSIFTIEVDGKISMKITFLSPVTPKDLERQSLTFSYLEVEVQTLDGKEHDVQLYTDISAGTSFVSLLTCHYSTTDTYQQNGSRVISLLLHNGISAPQKTSLTTNSGNATKDYSKRSAIKQNGEPGYIVALSHLHTTIHLHLSQYYATDTKDGLTYQTAFADDARLQFKNNGKLTNSKDTNFRAIRDKWPVFSYAVELGKVGSEATSTLFSIGLCQEDAVQFLGANGLAKLPSLWRSHWTEDVAAVSPEFLNLVPSALSYFLLEPSRLTNDSIDFNWTPLSIAEAFLSSCIDFFYLALLLP